ncbi:MAG: 6-bladed beta-propeller [Balneolaceae bacterium]|nr:6-bladed beta-propeller [Balneolaceae bacterium]
MHTKLRTMRTLHLNALSLLFLLAVSCTGSDQPVDPSELEVSLSGSEETHLLKDDMQLLSSIENVMALGDSALLVVDQSPNVALFENHVMTRTFGQQGEGPCEYTRVGAIDVSGDSLYVHAPRQSKVITYRLSTGECTGEVSHESFNAATYLARAGGDFYTARTRYAQSMPDSTRLFFRHARDGEPEPLSFTKSMADPIDTPVPITYPGLNFARSGDMLFAYLPFTRTMISLDANTRETAIHPMELSIPREEIESASDSRRILELINQQMEYVVRLLATDRWVVASVVHPGDAGSDQIRGLQFYTHQGDFIGEVNLDAYRLAIHGNRIIYIRTVEDPSSDYSYEVVYREFTVE